ncbi:polymorphic toxin type 37 domain-containing protein [Tolypothrix sp. VBCCA 56010]|uniref:polymorphic toxin type 37 domain-containing protein n=1 Tax=Tolypothrix sp. VBCCA 56010 TaxID=3137731 RepID=UPI003D7DC85E
MSRFYIAATCYIENWPAEYETTAVYCPLTQPEDWGETYYVYSGGLNGVCRLVGEANGEVIPIFSFAFPTILEYLIVTLGTGVSLTLFMEQLRGNPPQLPSESTEETDTPQNIPPIPNDPTQPPAEGWEWRGKNPPGGNEGAWYNPGTKESLHPDFNHPPPIGPHWDYVDPKKRQWRIFPDGRIEPKNTIDI